jgi:TorA maturation chaperone TorD
MTAVPMPAGPTSGSFISQRLRLLAELRGDLAKLGFARAEHSNEYEDHLAALCDVMRGLVGEEAVSSDAAAQPRRPRWPAAAAAAATPARP